MESQEREYPIEDNEACDSSSSVESSEDESEVEGEFEITHSRPEDAHRLPKFKLQGRFTVDGSSGSIASLATRPKGGDEIYLTNKNSSAILITSLQGNVKMKLDNDKIPVKDIAVDDNGHVVVVNASSHEIQIYDREGNLFNSFKHSSGDSEGADLETGLEMTCVDIDRNRKIAIGCCVGEKGMVIIYEMDGEFKRSIRFNIKPVYISSRFLLIAASDPKNRAVEVRHNDKTGELIRTLQMTDLGPGIEPCGILLTWDHLFVVTKATNNQNKSIDETKDKGAVQLFDTNSMAYLGVVISGLDNPRQIDVTHDDTLVITDGREIKLFKK